MRIPLELCFLVLTVDRFDFQMVSAFNHFGFWDQVLDRKQISAAERAWVPRRQRGCGHPPRKRPRSHFGDAIEFTNNLECKGPGTQCI